MKEYIKGNIEVQENKKVAVVLNDQPLRPSSPKRNISSSMDVPTLIVRYEDRDKFDQVTKDNDFTNPSSFHIKK